MKWVWAVAGLLGALGSGYYFSFNEASPAKTALSPSVQSPIDALMNDVQATQFDESGQVKQILTVTQWQHRQGASTAEWQNPHLALMSDAGTWEVSAKQGTSTQQELWGQIHEMHLSHHVTVHHSPSAKNKTKKGDWLLKTEYLLLLPDQQLAQTSHAVSVEGPWMQMKAKGLKADFQQDTIEFVQAVNSEYRDPKS